MIIAFCGFAQSGKDTAASFLVKAGYTKLAFADPLRAAVYALNPIIGIEGTYEYRVQYCIDNYGYEETKRRFPEYRALLQRMGTEVGREQFGENFWVERAMAQIQPGHNYVISDVRFPNEAAAVRAGGKLFKISRPGTGAVNAHISDTGVDKLRVDGVIPNGSDLDAFRSAVLEAAGIV